MQLFLNDQVKWSHFNCLLYFHKIAQTMIKNQLETLRNHLANQKFQVINLNSSLDCSNLVEFIRSLEAKKDNLKIVKNLMVAFGLPALIYLKNFYAKITEQFALEHEVDLQFLGAVAQQMICHQRIEAISFIFKYGVDQYKPIPKQEHEVAFIQYIKELESMNKSVRDGIMSHADYDQFLKKAANIRALPKFSIESVKDFALSESELNELNAIKEEQAKELSVETFENSVIESDCSSIYYYSQNMVNFSEKNQLSLSSQISELSDVINSISYEKKASPLEIEEINDISENLCCRKFFYFQEQVKFSEDIRTSFLQVKYPFQYSYVISIKNIMCSFLNSEGGIIYIGISKDANGRRWAVGDQYSESLKEDILRSFRSISQTIEPDVITHKMYAVDFVPICAAEGPKKYMPGQFIIKVNIRYGIRDEIYSYRESGYDHFPFRNHKEIFMRDGRQLLNTLKDRIKNPLPVPIPLHEYPCIRPDIGEQVHEDNYNQLQIPKKPMIVYQQKRTIDPPAQRKVLPIQKFFQAIPPPQKKAEGKSFEKVLPPELTKSQDFSMPIAQQSPKAIRQLKQSYFFVVGINEKQLIPVFAKKNLDGKIKIESSKNSNIVVKAFGDEVISKVRKILTKIEEKYASMSIRVHEITLEIEVDDVQKSLQIVCKNFKSAEFRPPNRFKFKIYRQSLQAFVMLEEEKIKAKFIKI